MNHFAAMDKDIFVDVGNKRFYCREAFLTLMYPTPDDYVIPRRFMFGCLSQEFRPTKFKLDIGQLTKIDKIDQRIGILIYEPYRDEITEFPDYHYQEIEFNMKYTSQNDSYAKISGVIGEDNIIKRNGIIEVQCV